MSAVDPGRVVLEDAGITIGVVPFEREAVERYFDLAIYYWEARISEFKRENVRPHPRYDGARERLQIAGCYLDAYRQIRAAILGLRDSSTVEPSAVNGAAAGSSPAPSAILLDTEEGDEKPTSPDPGL